MVQGATTTPSSAKSTSGGTLKALGFMFMKEGAFLYLYNLFFTARTQVSTETGYVLYLFKIFHWLCHRAGGTRLRMYSTLVHLFRSPLSKQDLSLWLVCLLVSEL